MSNGVDFETNGVNNESQNGGNEDPGLRRRNSIERYRPGAYFNEEREKLRRRAHFGERRLDNKENKSNGNRKGQGFTKLPKIFPKIDVVIWVLTKIFKL